MSPFEQRLKDAKVPKRLQEEIFDRLKFLEYQWNYQRSEVQRLEILLSDERIKNTIIDRMN